MCSGLLLYASSLQQGKLDEEITYNVQRKQTDITRKTKGKVTLKMDSFARSDVKYRNVASGYTSRRGTQNLQRKCPPTEYYMFSWRMRRSNYIYASK